MKNILKNFKFKNHWKVHNKSGRKVSIKIRVGKVTVLDVYFTLGVAFLSVTLFNYTVQYAKTK